ncbi:MAG TPA: choice-of-anchor B family protein [Flavobacteriales bacterium]|nr:choice-of-anchor B family protein [Flavobacteriales bacterium]
MRNILLLASVFTSINLSAQLNITQLGYLDYQALHSTGLSNLWGYVDEFGNEYAIVGAQNGISIVDVTNPATPTEVFYYPGSNSIWREVKTYNNYAYITTEASDGMVIINLNPLPGTITTGDVSIFNGPASDPWISEHSLFIDEATGVMFVHGTDRGNGGAILYDLNSSPTNPNEIGDFDDYYVHDSYSRGDTLYACHINNGFVSFTDVSTPSSISYMAANQNTPMNFSHNCWLSDDGKYLFTTDEVSGAWIGAYDISDFTDIKEVDRIRNSETSGSIPHNTYWLNNYIVTSYYRDGVTIHDVTDPSNMIQVGNFDTTPLSGDGFNGAWGVYPFLPSGNLLVSDIELGLFILGPTYVRACYLDGNVKDATTLANLNGVHVELLTTADFDDSDLAGNYSTGHGIPGTYDVVYSKPGYYNDTVTVTLVSATTVTQNVLLQPLPTFSYSGNVISSAGSSPVAGAQVLVENGTYSYTATTDASGNFVINPFAIDTTNDVFEVTIGMWGYETYCQTGVIIDGTNGPLNITLDPGYYDDFTLDFGWTEAATSSTGVWVRREPFGTMSGSFLANPEVDVTGDCSNKCFVTGNENNTSVGADDVDAGSVTLISPTFSTTGMTDPYVSFYLWYRNTGGFGSPNDTITISIYDGTLKVGEKVHINNLAEHNWIPRSFQLSDYTSATTGLHIEIKAQDYNPGHIVEAGVDLFRVTDGNAFVSTEENKVVNENVMVYPNPASETINIVCLDQEIATVDMVDMSGKLIMRKTVNAINTSLDISLFTTGVYTVRVISQTGKTTMHKIIKR